MLGFDLRIKKCLFLISPSRIQPFRKFRALFEHGSPQTLEPFKERENRGQGNNLERLEGN